MPLNYGNYLNDLFTANPNFGKWRPSSLAALNGLLQQLSPVAPPAPALRKQIIETLGRIPHAKQLKYQTALTNANTNIPLGLPAVPFAFPVNPRMSLEVYVVGAAQWGQGPADSRADGWFHHDFRLAWDSSSGNMADLLQTWNREEVTFLQNPAGLPFNHLMANTPQAYFWGVSSVSDGGEARDDHFFMHPSLMLVYPIAPGIVRAEQTYQYSPDLGTTWYAMENGAFIFDKGVRAGAGTGGFVFVLNKENDPNRGNVRPFHFEVEYDIGAPPVNVPVSYHAVQGRGGGNTAQLAQYTVRVVASG